MEFLGYLTNCWHANDSALRSQPASHICTSDAHDVDTMRCVTQHRQPTLHVPSARTGNSRGPFVFRRNIHSNSLLHSSLSWKPQTDRNTAFLQRQYFETVCYLVASISSPAGHPCDITGNMLRFTALLHTPAISPAIRCAITAHFAHPCDITRNMLRYYRTFCTPLRYHRQYAAPLQHSCTHLRYHRQYAAPLQHFCTPLRYHPQYVALLQHFCTPLRYHPQHGALLQNIFLRSFDSSDEWKKWSERNALLAAVPRNWHWRQTSEIAEACSNQRH